MNKQNNTVGIIGLGAVGTAAFKGMETHHDVVGYDIDGRGEWDAILQTKAVLVCVPTDLSENRRNGDEYRRWRVLCNGPVQEVATRLDESSYKGLVIYKSTLNVGTMDKLASGHPQLRLVYMPEFLREKDAVEWFADPDRLVTSGKNEDVDEALSLFEWVSSTVPRMPMKHMEAEIGKLAHNAYIATKVTFTCEMERLCLLHDVDPHPVMETVWRDRRVLNPAHLTPGLGGFDGKCVPKDTEALASIDWCSLRYRDSKGRRRDQSLIQTGLLQHVLMIGTKNSVMKRHNRAIIGGRESRRQPMGKLSKAFDSMANIFIKTLNFTIILGLFILCAFGIWAGGDYLWDYEPEHYIVDFNESSFNFNEQDYLTFLSFNSSMIDYETTEHTICYPNYSPDYYREDGTGYNSGYSEDQECESWTNYHPVLVNESGNYSFALSGSGSFLDDCFQTNCMAVGKVREVNNKHYWVEVTDYRIILE